VKPTQFYKLCGQRTSIKLITTYNNVIIRLAFGGSTNDLPIGSGFTMTYRIISDPSACKLSCSLFL
jgi:hypothetical protein